MMQINSHPQGFILRQGWAALDFGGEREIAHLHRLTTQTPAFFDETVRRHVEAIEKEMMTLQTQAEELAKEIEDLTGDSPLGSGWMA